MGRTSIDLRWACGHRATLAGVGTDITSECPTCGERRVTFVAAPTPSFRGTATGPHVTTVELDPVKVSFGD